MPEKDPTTYTLMTYGWVVLLATWGGIVSFIRKIKSGESRPNNIMEFVGEIVTSGFAGVITFYLCEASGMSPLLTAVAVGVCGHMGTRAIYQIERIIQGRLGA